LVLPHLPPLGGLLVAVSLPPTL
jgi:hypothetical protein